MCVRATHRVEQALDPVQVMKCDVAADGLRGHPDGDLIAGVARVRGIAEPAAEIVIWYACPQLLEDLVPDCHVPTKCRASAASQARPAIVTGTKKHSFPSGHA